MYIRAFLVWLLLAVAAIVMGAVRVGAIVPVTGESAGHLLGTLLFVLAMLAVIRATIRWVVSSLDKGSLLRIGATWLVMTVAFEFLFGHYAVGHSWAHLLHDYNVASGRVWVLVPLTCLVAPLVLGRRLRNQRG